MTYPTYFEALDHQQMLAAAHGRDLRLTLGVFVQRAGRARQPDPEGGSLVRRAVSL